jgi:hypothetical protein
LNIAKKRNCFWHTVYSETRPATSLMSRVLFAFIMGGD